jgi:hypothetical protein
MPLRSARVTSPVPTNGSELGVRASSARSHASLRRARCSASGSPASAQLLAAAAGSLVAVAFDQIRSIRCVCLRVLARTSASGCRRRWTRRSRRWSAWPQARSRSPSWLDFRYAASLAPPATDDFAAAQTLTGPAGTPSPRQSARPPSQESQTPTSRPWLHQRSAGRRRTAASSASTPTGAPSPGNSTSTPARAVPRSPPPV